MDPGTTHPYQKADPRRPSLSSSAFSIYAAGSPDHGFWWVPELSRTAGSTANGTARSSSTTLRVLQPRLLPGDPRPTTPPDTTTLRDPHPHRHRRPRVPEPDLIQRPELINGSPNTAVRDDSNGTPEGSTMMNAYSYTAARVLHNDTPPGRVLSNTNLTTKSSTTTTTHIPAFYYLRSGRPVPLHRASGELGHGNHRRMGRRTLSPRATPARPSLFTRPTCTSWPSRTPETPTSTTTERPRGRQSR